MPTTPRPAPVPRPGSEVARALEDYVEARRLAVAEARRDLALNELDVRALLFIAKNPGARPSHVRDHLGITSAGVTTLIDRLVERGAVRRDLDEDDRRVNHITAIVDLDAEPWAQLRAFDAAVDFAAAELGADDGRRVAAQGNPVGQTARDLGISESCHDR